MTDHTSARAAFDHHPTAERLAAYLIGDLPPDARDHITAHLRQCATCQRELAHLERLRDALRHQRPTAEAPTSPSLAPAVLWRLAADPTSDGPLFDAAWADDAAAGAAPIDPRPVLPPPVVLSSDNRSAFSAGPSRRVRGARPMEPQDPTTPTNGMDIIASPLPAARRNEMAAPARRSYPLVAVAALVALAALLVFVAFPRHGGPTGPATGATASATTYPTPTATGPVALSTTVGPLASVGFLTDIQMLSATDGYLVGNGGSNNGIIAHYDGTTWRTVVTVSNAEFNSVAMLSPTEGWAVGVVNLTQSLILHLSGGTWRVVPTNLTGGLLRVMMISPTEGWALGSTGEGGSEYVTHYQNGQWSAPLSLSGDLHGLVATSATNAWIGGTTIYQRANGGWPAVAQTPGNILAMSLPSPTFGWAVGIWNGAAKRASGFGGPPLLMRFDGTSWTRVAAPAAVTIGTLYGVAVTAGDDGWAVGASPTTDPSQTRNALILRDSGGQWSVSGAAFPCDLNAVANVSANEAWAIGACTPTNGPNLTGVFHYLNGQWTRVNG